MDEWDFSVEEMTTLGRKGSLPFEYLEAMRMRQGFSHVALNAEIVAALADAAEDPQVLALLNAPL
jgi:hypothetical protein